MCVPVSPGSVQGKRVCVSVCVSQSEICSIYYAVPSLFLVFVWISICVPVCARASMPCTPSCIKAIVQSPTGWLGVQGAHVESYNCCDSHFHTLRITWVNILPSPLHDRLLYSYLTPAANQQNRHHQGKPPTKHVLFLVNE